MKVWKLVSGIISIIMGLFLFPSFYSGTFFVKTIVILSAIFLLAGGLVSLCYLNNHSIKLIGNIFIALSYYLAFFILLSSLGLYIIITLWSFVCGSVSLAFGMIIDDSERINNKKKSFLDTTILPVKSINTDSKETLFKDIQSDDILSEKKSNSVNNQSEDESKNSIPQKTTNKKESLIMKHPIVSGLIIAFSTAIFFILFVFVVVNINRSSESINTSIKTNNSSITYESNDDSINNEETTEAETEKEKGINDYKKVSARELCYNPEKYKFQDIRTTFRITKASDFTYKYVTYGIGKYDKVEISCLLYDEDMKLSKGMNVTVGGNCYLEKSVYKGEYGEKRKKLTINIIGNVWKIPKNSHFKPFGKSKTAAYLSSFPKLYSDYNVDIYYIDAEDDYGDVEARFLVNNKTSKQLTFQADTITFDGRSYNNIIMSDDVAAKSKGIITPTISDCKNTNPKNIGFKFTYYDEIIDSTIRKEITVYSHKVG